MLTSQPWDKCVTDAALRTTYSGSLPRDRLPARAATDERAGVAIPIRRAVAQPLHESERDDDDVVVVDDAAYCDVLAAVRGLRIAGFRRLVERFHNVALADDHARRSRVDHVVGEERIQDA